MASPSLYTQVAGVAEWHINADEPIVPTTIPSLSRPGRSAVSIAAIHSAYPTTTRSSSAWDLNTPVTPSSGIYVSTTTPGSVGLPSFGSEDILKWDGNAWSVWF